MTPTTMRAVRFYGVRDIRVEEVPVPEPTDGEILAQVEVALTDGTDAKAFRRGHPVLLSDPPSPFGHEFCGYEVETGRRIVAANSAPCGECPPCSRGEESLCEDLFPLLNGAYAEFVLIPARIAEKNVLAVPKLMPAEIAAMTEPLACCLRGVERAEVSPGQTLAVVGLGPIGLMLCAAAKDAGATVIGVGGRPERRELARDFGAIPGDGKGADVVIEAAGTEEAWASSLELVRPGGTVLFFGGRERAVDTFRLHYEELTLRGSFHHTPRSLRSALAFLASGAFPWERLVTHQVGLEGIAGLFSDPPQDLLKAAVLP